MTYPINAHPITENIEQLVAFIKTHDNDAFYNPTNGLISVLSSYVQSYTDNTSSSGFKIDEIAPTMKAARDILGY